MWEAGAPAVLSGITTRTVTGEYGVVDVEQLRGLIRPDSEHYVRTRIVSLENTHNMAGGTVYPTTLTHAICAKAHDAGLKVHLDGARVFNAAAHLGQNVAEITKKLDSVQFCFSKGLGAPVGSMIVGSRDLIEHCRVKIGRAHV